MRDLIDAWRQDARRRRAALLVDPTAGATRSAAPDGAGHPLILTAFQSDWHKFATTMRQVGIEP